MIMMDITYMRQDIEAVAVRLAAMVGEWLLILSDQLLIETQ